MHHLGHSHFLQVITKHFFQLVYLQPSCEVVDKCSNKIINKALKFNYNIILIADHGNADIMINKDGSPHTYHTTNPVPFILIDEKFNSKLKNGILADVAPTILDIMNIKIPKEMTGKSLI